MGLGVLQKPAQFVRRPGFHLVPFGAWQFGKVRYVPGDDTLSEGIVESFVKCAVRISYRLRTQCLRQFDIKGVDHWWCQLAQLTGTQPFDNASDV
jgi:hypothetical protein